MHIATKPWIERPVLIAALAAVILGVSLTYLTWQNLERQRQAALQHAEIAARFILRGAERALDRGLRSMHRPDGTQTVTRLDVQSRGMFQELVDKADVLFISLYGAEGRLVITARSETDWEIPIPPEAFQALNATGEWSRILRVDRHNILIHARKTAPIFLDLCQPERDTVPGGPGQGHGRDQGQGQEHGMGLGRGMGQGMGQGRGMGQGMGMGWRRMLIQPRSNSTSQCADPDAACFQSGNASRDALRIAPRTPKFPPPLPEPDDLPPLPPEARGAQATIVEGPPAYLFIGVNLDRHLALYNDFRKAAIWQTAFVLLAAVLIWGLSLAYVRRRDREGRLVHLEHFHSKLLDNIPDGLVTLDDRGRVLSANPAASRLLRNDEAGLIGRPWDALAQAGLSPIPEEGGVGKGGSRWVQYRAGERFVEVLSLPVGRKHDVEAEDAAADDETTLVLLRDRTDIKALEEDLNEARKLAAFGRVAAGVAHEIRNPLSSLRGFAQFFASKLAGQQPAENYAKIMVQEADRLNRVITDMLFLAKPRPIEPMTVNLPGLANELTHLLTLDFEHRGARMEQALETSEVYADPDALKQALLNLLVNSLAVAPQGEGRVILRSWCDARGVWLAVADNGPGMTPEEREHALEPFFTTRKDGTGLGLAIVHKIVREHKGQVVIVSESGQGAEIRLFFPLRGVICAGDAVEPKVE